MGGPENILWKSSGASRGAPHREAVLKVREGTFDASKQGSGALGKVKFRQIGSTPTPWSGPFRDHGLRAWSQSPSDAVNPVHEGFCVWSALFFGRPRAQGVGVDPCLLRSKVIAPSGRP